MSAVCRILSTEESQVTQVNPRKTIIGLAIAIVLTSSLALGRTKQQDKSTSRSTKVTLFSPASLGNGTILPAGSYKLTISQNGQVSEASFYQRGKLIGKATIKVETQSTRNLGTRISTDTKGDKQVITSISPNGWEERLVFPEGAGGTPESGQ
jgi:uncharacterized membrane protein affecting hemolysin expression